MSVTGRYNLLIEVLVKKQNLINEFILENFYNFLNKRFYSLNNPEMVERFFFHFIKPTYSILFLVP